MARPAYPLKSPIELQVKGVEAISSCFTWLSMFRASRYLLRPDKTGPNPAEPVAKYGKSRPDTFACNPESGLSTYSASSRKISDLRAASDIDSCCLDKLPWTISRLIGNAYER